MREEGVFYVVFHEKIRKGAFQLEDRWILFGLHEIKGIGTKTIARFVDANIKWNELLDGNQKKWVNMGVKESLADRIASTLTPSWIKKRRELIDKNNITVVTILDEQYPELMKQAVGAPVVLYVKGQLALLNVPAIAVVGTRVPTAYGRQITTSLTRQLCEAGMSIVSGLARGVDFICHQTALACGGNTLAVLGTSFDQMYPAEHAPLAQKIVEKGLLVTEYPLGTKSHPGLFPQRNRIMAALSLGTVVIEAEAKSGSLITADFALEANREVFAVPGPITSPKSEGTLNLIKQGAKVVTSVMDILEEYSNISLARSTIPDQSSLCTPNTYREHSHISNELTHEEISIIRLLDDRILSFDQLIDLLKWDFGHLHSVLLSLIIKKHIVQLLGTTYRRI